MQNELFERFQSIIRIFSLLCHRVFDVNRLNYRACSKKASAPVDLSKSYAIGPRSAGLISRRTVPTPQISATTMDLMRQSNRFIHSGRVEVICTSSQSDKWIRSQSGRVTSKTALKGNGIQKCCFRLWNLGFRAVDYSHITSNMS